MTLRPRSKANDQVLRPDRRLRRVRSDGDGHAQSSRSNRRVAPRDISAAKAGRGGCSPSAAFAFLPRGTEDARHFRAHCGGVGWRAFVDSGHFDAYPGFDDLLNDANPSCYEASSFTAAFLVTSTERVPFGLRRLALTMHAWTKAAATTTRPIHPWLMLKPTPPTIIKQRCPNEEDAKRARAQHDFVPVTLIYVPRRRERAVADAARPASQCLDWATLGRRQDRSNPVAWPPAPAKAGCRRKRSFVRALAIWAAY